MSKLLRNIDTNALLRVDEIEMTNSEIRQQPEVQTPNTALPSPEDIVQTLNEVARRDRDVSHGENQHHLTLSSAQTATQDASLDLDTSLDSFDCPQFIATASRALGSPARLRAVRKTMGRLSPRSNERFIDELQLGLKEKPKTQKIKDPSLEDISERIEPPEIPSVDSSELEIDDREALLSLSPVSVERTAAPAVLRRKVRRLDRGYRSVDVLRARLQGTSLAEIAASPTSRRRGERASRWRSKIRTLDLGEEEVIIDICRSKRERATLSHRSSQEESDEISSDGAPPKKRKRRNESDRGESNETEDTYKASDPLAILVDAAAAEEQKQRTIERRVRDSSRNWTEDGTAVGRQVSSQEPRRKRKSTSRQRVLVSD